MMNLESFSAVNQVLGDSVVLYSQDFFDVTNITNYHLTHSLIYQIIVILVLVYYLFVVKFNRCGRLLKKTLRPKYVSEEIFDDSSIMTKNFLLNTHILWALISAIFLLKAADIFFHDGVMSIVRESYLPYLILPLCFVLPLFALYGRVVLWVSSQLTYSAELVSALSYLKRLYVSTAVIFVTPVVVLFSLFEGRGLKFMFFLGVLQLFFIFFIWVYKTYMLFLEKKVSSLNWFLYLCAVEIFPLSLIIFLIR